MGDRDFGLHDFNSHIARTPSGRRLRRTQDVQDTETGTGTPDDTDNGSETDSEPREDDE